VACACRDVVAMRRVDSVLRFLSLPVAKDASSHT
jgi:hypothetical protein